MPARRRAPTLLAALGMAVLVGVVAVGWATWLNQEQARPPTEPNGGVEGGLWRYLAAAAPSGTAAGLAPAAKAASVPSAADLSSDPRAIELCGWGWTIPPEGRDQSPFPPAQIADIDAAIERGLREHPDPRARAVLAFGFDEPVATAALVRARDAVVRAAARGQDPSLYQIALDLCSRPFSKTAACQLVSARHYVQLDPDNAHGWLMMAGEAVERGDAAGVDEALFQASRSLRYDERNGLYAAVSMTILPQDAPQWVQQVLLLRGFGLQAATPLPAIGAVFKHCASAALQDANRRQQCDALAHLFVDRGRSLSALMMGANLAKKLGWPADQVRQLEDEHRLAMAVAVGLEPEGRRMLGCAAHGSFRKWVADVQVHGERQTSRQQVAASGRTATEWIRTSDERMARELQRYEAERAPAATGSSPIAP